MPDYIDLHNHILHDLDDGPRTLKEAVRLARSLREAGYGTLVCTPHAANGLPTPVLIENRITQLQDALQAEQIELTLCPGAEQHIEPLTLELLEQGRLLTLNRSRYLLLELPFYQSLPPYTLTLIESLKAKGYQPIIPHPERVSALQQKPQLAYDLYRAGAIFQITWGALTGRLGPAGKETALLLIEAGLGHLFATDSHTQSGRVTEIESAAQRLATLLGPAAKSLMLSTRPQQVISDQPLELPAPVSLAQLVPKRSFLQNFKLKKGRWGRS